MADEHLIVVLH